VEVVSSYVTDLGPAAALPFVFFLFALLLRQTAGDALRAALKIGIGFIGINLVIGILFTFVGPAAQALAGRFDVNLTVIDVGWPSTAAIAFGAQVGAFAIPVGLAVNVVLLAVGLTKTLNIDLWNYWHIAFTGALVAILTDSFAAGLLTAGIHMVILLALADWSAPLIQRYYGYPGVSLPHGTSAPYVVLAIPLNWLFDRIPGLRSSKADPESIQKRFGVLGESTVLGVVLGLLIGIFAYGFDDPRADSIAILTLAINLGAVMLLLPRMVAILMEALLPISEGAQALVKERFPNRDIYIGLDSAIAIGAPAVIATSLLLVPITLLLAIVLPGNRVLPLVDLATIPFIVCMMVPIFKGNLLKSVIGGTIAMAMGLYIATGMSGLMTQAADRVGFQPEQAGATEISSLVDGGNPLSGLIVLVGRAGWAGIVGLAVVSLVFAWWVKARGNPRAAEREAEPTLAPTGEA
jgi:PTS system galactitol-specific IIC component